MLIDLDPHGSLTSYFGFNPENIDHSSYSIFQNTGVNEAELIKKTNWPTLDILPASPALAALDRQLGAGSGKGLILQRWLARMQNHYDHVFIDCAPMLGVLMVNALVAADHLLVPAQTEFLCLNGLQRMRRTVEMIQQSQKTDISWLIIPTMFDRRTRASPQSLRRMREQFGNRVWGQIVPVDTKFRGSQQSGHFAFDLLTAYPWGVGVSEINRIFAGDVFTVASRGSCLMSQIPEKPNRLQTEFELGASCFAELFGSAARWYCRRAHWALAN